MGGGGGGGGYLCEGLVFILMSSCGRVLHMCIHVSLPCVYVCVCVFTVCGADGCDNFFMVARPRSRPLRGTEQDSGVVIHPSLQRRKHQGVCARASSRPSPRVRARPAGMHPGHLRSQPGGPQQTRAQGFHLRQRCWG